MIKKPLKAIHHTIAEMSRITLEDLDTRSTAVTQRHTIRIGAEGRKNGPVCYKGERAKHCLMKYLLLL